MGAGLGKARATRRPTVTVRAKSSAASMARAKTAALVAMVRPAALIVMVGRAASVATVRRAAVAATVRWAAMVERVSSAAMVAMARRAASVATVRRAAMAATVRWAATAASAAVVHSPPWLPPWQLLPRTGPPELWPLRPWQPWPRYPRHSRLLFWTVLLDCSFGEGSFGRPPSPLRPHSPRHRLPPPRHQTPPPPPLQLRYLSQLLRGPPQRRHGCHPCGSSRRLAVGKQAHGLWHGRSNACSKRAKCSRQPARTRRAARATCLASQARRRRLE